MYNKVLFLSILFLLQVFKFFPHEGMWIPSLVKAFENDMQAMGMRLSAEDIYDVNSSSIKDAIIHFNGGCTAELVSSKGLLLTNHHCGYSQIQSHSSLEKDYLKYGFWASNKSEELSNPGLTASRVVRIEDVTNTVLFETEGLADKERYSKIQTTINKLIADAQTGTHYTAKIKAFNYGNDYYMIVKETFKDVRLVGAPPNSIGKFGGDTDNWVWPRHTGDFSVFRIYSDQNNEPNEYSESNVPYTPLHFLPVSMKKRSVGDFTMVYGFPGTTEQHLSSRNLSYIMDKERPARIEMREKSLSVIDASMRSSDLLRIKYASKQARIANGWKKWIGQVGGLKTVDAIQIKINREKEYNDMTLSKQEWVKKYGRVINDMNALVDRYKDSDFAYSMVIEYLYVGPELFKRAREISKFLSNYSTLDENGELDNEIEKQIKLSKGFFKNYDNATDKRIFELLTEEYVEQMGDSPLGSILKNNSAKDLAEIIYEKSILTSELRFNKFMEKLSKNSFNKLKNKDLGYILWMETNDRFIKNIVPEVRVYRASMDRLLKTYVAGKLEMFPDANHWPDANSSMRITYGKLEGSAPHDGMRYIEHTNIDGIITKNNSRKVF